MRTILLFILLLPCFAAAQTDDFQQKKDSLWQAVKQSKGEEKILSYGCISNYCIQ